MQAATENAVCVAAVRAVQGCYTILAAPVWGPMEVRPHMPLDCAVDREKRYGSCHAPSEAKGGTTIASGLVGLYVVSSTTIENSHGASAARGEHEHLTLNPKPSK